MWTRRSSARKSPRSATERPGIDLFAPGKPRGRRQAVKLDLGGLVLDECPGAGIGRKLKLPPGKVGVTVGAVIDAQVEAGLARVVLLRHRNSGSGGCQHLIRAERAEEESNHRIRPTAVVELARSLSQLVGVVLAGAH